MYSQRISEPVLGLLERILGTSSIVPLHYQFCSTTSISTHFLPRFFMLFIIFLCTLFSCIDYFYFFLCLVADPSRRLSPRGAVSNILFTTAPLPPLDPKGTYLCKYFFFILFQSVCMKSYLSFVKHFYLFVGTVGASSYDYHYYYY